MLRFLSISMLLTMALELCVLLLMVRHSSALAFAGKDRPFLSSSPRSAAPKLSFGQESNNILIMDHWNINYEKGRQDWLVTFWVDFLQCALDPRKVENLEDPDHRQAAGLSSTICTSPKRTLWANIGAHQFHLPQGKPSAQVLDGSITLVYPSGRLQKLLDRETQVAAKLQGSKFEVRVDETRNQLEVTDPWGCKFIIVQGSDHDPRGRQPGEVSEGLAMRDLTIHTPPTANLGGIGRFYENVLGARAIVSDDSVIVNVGPYQTLTFRPSDQTSLDAHVDLRSEKYEAPPDKLAYLSNYGPHVSIYVADLAATYERADKLGVTYVNPRFSRQAYIKEEAQKDCMFRCLDIVDPNNIAAGPILQLEHEIRSAVKMDGTKYKSCPFDEVPPECKNY